MTQGSVPQFLLLFLATCTLQTLHATPTHPVLSIALLSDKVYSHVIYPLFYSLIPIRPSITYVIPTTCREACGRQERAGSLLTGWQWLVVVVSSVISNILGLLRLVFSSALLELRYR